MDYRIVEKPAFQIFGRGTRVSMDNAQSVIPTFWDDVMSDGSFDKILGAAERNGMLGDVTLGICAEFAPDMSGFTYYVGAEKGATVPDGLTELSVPASTWAVFPGRGAMPDSIQSLWGRIMGEFLPAGEYAHAPGPDLEVYPKGDPMQPDYQFEIWIPVVKK